MQRSLKVAASFIMTVLFTSVASAAPFVVEVANVADGTVVSSTPGASYPGGFSNDDHLTIGQSVIYGNFGIYLKFDLQGTIHGPAIILEGTPNGPFDNWNQYQVTGTPKLYLYGYSGITGTINFNAYKVTSYVDPNNVSYNNIAPFIEGTPAFSGGVHVGWSENAMPTSLLNDWIHNPSQNFGIVLIPGISGGTIDVLSNNFGQFPDIVMELIPAQETTPAPTPGALALLGVGLLSFGAIRRRLN